MDIKPFQKLKYRIHEVPHGTDLLHRFQGLASIKEFSAYGKPDRNKVIRYIIYCYDPGSDFIETFPKLMERKEAAMIEAGFKRDKQDKFEEYVQDIINLQSEEHVNMIFAYLQHVDNRTWMMRVSTGEMFDEYQRLIIKPITIDTKNNEKEKDILAAADMKKKLREECNLMHQDMKRYDQELFGDNDDLKDQFSKKQRISPERIANAK